MIRRMMVVAALATGPAAAQECLFDVECFDTEGCVDGGFPLTVGDDAVSTDFGDLAVVARTGGDAQGGAEGVVVAEGMGMTLMVMPGVEGAARASTFMDGIMVNYAGSCDATGEDG